MGPMYTWDDPECSVADTEPAARCKKGKALFIYPGKDVVIGVPVHPAEHLKAHR